MAVVSGMAFQLISEIKFTKIIFGAKMCDEVNKQ